MKGNNASKKLDKDKSELKSEQVRSKKIPEKYLPVPLVPAWLILPLWFVSLAVPNLVYSGVRFADTLHILKWTVTGVPVAIAALVAGIRLCMYGKERIAFKLDLFSAIWALMIAYAAVQPFWVDVFSPTALVLELVCVFTIWAFYVLSVGSFPENGLRVMLFFAAMNAAINVGFAELQLSGTNDLAFLVGTPFEFLKQYSSIILPTPDNYIGNTAQNNMMGLWCSVNVVNLVYLLILDIWHAKDSGVTFKRVFLPALCVALTAASLILAVGLGFSVFYVIAGILLVMLPVIAWRMGNSKRDYLTAFALLLFAIIFWGLLKTTSRSGLLSFVTGFALLIILVLWKFRMSNVMRFVPLIMIMCVLGWGSTYSQRADGFVERAQDLVENTSTVAGRIGIWTTSYSMFKEHPMGVGTGQFKWHYLEAQREGFKTDFVNRDWYIWQYTHWAHNEFLQWFCEGGWIGGIMLIIMYLAWFVPALIGIFRTERDKLSIYAVWGFAIVSVISFAALFTRPFHRIENMVWIALAFAMSNREFLTGKLRFNIIKSDMFEKFLGVACIAASVAGVVYISDGIRGNYILRQALSTQRPDLQLYYLNQADSFPITHEEAQRNLALHYIQLGEQTEDNEMIRKGLGLLWAHFQREPHSEDISRLLTLSQRFQDEEILTEVASLFKPGMYELVRRPVRASDGQIYNALVLINAPKPEAQEVAGDQGTKTQN